MIYLSGHCWRLLKAQRRPDLGAMASYGGLPGGLYDLVQAGLPWGADNGCFLRSEKFTEGGYLEWLESWADHRNACLFATARDELGNAEATLDLALPMLPKLRSLGYRAALVAQDGLDRLPVPWSAFDVLFVGGSTSFKLSEAAYQLVAEAKRRGKQAHMGRVNSLQRLRAAHAAGYDSADGTFVAFGPDRRFPELLGWLDAVNQAPRLFGVTA